MKFKVYLLCALFFIASCTKEKQNAEPLQSTELESTLRMEKIPVFDEANQKVVKMKYRIEADNIGLTFRNGMIENEYDVDAILDNVTTFGYSWKIIEDVRDFELQEFGTTRVNASHESLILQTNDQINLTKGDDCGQIVSAGAIAAVELFISFAEDDPYILFGGEECIEDSPYYELWLLLGTFYPDQDIVSAIEDVWEDSRIIALQNATSFGGATNIDFHSVTICDLPAGTDPLTLFENLRSEFYKNPFDSDCDTDFELYPQFTDSDWMNSPEGTLFEIEILFFESGDVVCSYYDIVNDVDTEFLVYRWIFSTVYGEESGWHPVSGNRQFGLYPDGNGCWVFYTAGVDRQTNWYHVIFGGETAFEDADAFWDCIINQVDNYAVGIGASTSNVTSVSCRPDISELVSTWSQYCYNPPLFEMYPPCTICE